MQNEYVLIAVMALMTMLLRFLPFILLKFTKETPKIIIHLGNVLPQAAIAMLVVYCLRNTSFVDKSSLVPTLFGSLTAALMQMKFKNVIYSIISATAVYMILIHLF